MIKKVPPPQYISGFDIEELVIYISLWHKAISWLSKKILKKVVFQMGRMHIKKKRRPKIKYGAHLLLNDAPKLV